MDDCLDSFPADSPTEVREALHTVVLYKSLNLSEFVARKIWRRQRLERQDQRLLDAY